MTHSPPSFDWDDLKHLLAVARHRSTLAAGRALGVDQSTVQRRLAELERRLGKAVVERHPTGYRLTPFGHAMLPHAELVEQSVLAFQQQLANRDADNEGVIRMTCPEAIILRLTQIGFLDRFHARYPQFQLRLVSSDRYLDLKKGEADVALRSGDTDDDELVGRKIGDSHWAVYASPGYIERHGRPASIAELAQHALVGFDESMAKHRVSQWLREVAPDTPLVARSNSVLGLIHSVRAGVGIAPLPTPLGDHEPDLVRVLGPVPELDRAWRLLTTAELRKTPRISAFFEFIVSELDALRPIVTG
jgi:DNA-binding transcriptional LysR family regulator